MNFEVVTTSTGAISIRNNLVNEIMHNPVGPWIEANALYVEQSRFRQALSERCANDLVLFDVGLGAASNAVAALRAAIDARTHDTRRLQIISFENDLSLLEFVLSQCHEFRHLQGFAPALESILTSHRWSSPCGSIDWQLRYGDFTALIENETHKPEIIFYDPYSPAVNHEMWSVENFMKLRRVCYQENEKITTKLYTYSQATPVRVALLLAGFYIGHGISTGLKEETTQASTHLNKLDQPMGEKWWQRWLRSQSPFPFETLEDAKAGMKERMLQHPQFLEFSRVPWEQKMSRRMKARNVKKSIRLTK